MNFRKSLVLPLLLMALVASAQKPRLDYMSRNSAEQIFGFAKVERRPVMVFVHSTHCYASRQFMREVLNKDDVVKTFRMNFSCMNADVGSRNGNSYARKNNLLIMPVVMLYSHDAGMNYVCKLKLDKKMVMDQVECFLSACNIREQILLLKETNQDLTMSEAAKRIGKSYARIDHRKGTKTSISKNIYRYTLNLKIFKEFEVGYKAEWEKLGGGSGRKEDEEVTQNNEAEKQN